MIDYKFTCLKQLQACFMPFLKYQGLFFPIVSILQMGEKVDVRFFLPDDRQCYEFNGEVVWINAKQDMYRRQEGVGVAFLSEHIVVEKIKTRLDLTEKKLDILSYTL